MHNELCLTVHCPSLPNYDDGVINCSLGDDGVLSYEDTCNLTCNTGYELIGNNTRICQSDILLYLSESTERSISCSKFRYSHVALFI